MSRSIEEFLATRPNLYHAWQQYLKYGKEGPPVGTKMVAIGPGYNCGSEGGTLLVIIEPEQLTDSERYILTRSDHKGVWPGSTFQSLTERKDWWFAINERVDA